MFKGEKKCSYTAWEGKGRQIIFSMAWRKPSKFYRPTPQKLTGYSKRVYVNTVRRGNAWTTSTLGVHIMKEGYYATRFVLKINE